MEQKSQETQEMWPAFERTQLYQRSGNKASIEKDTEQEHEKKSIMPCANSEGHDRTAHLRSLIMAFSVRRCITQHPMIL